MLRDALAGVVWVVIVVLIAVLAPILVVFGSLYWKGRQQ